jgi:hypothetical protein
MNLLRLLLTALLGVFALIAMILIALAAGVLWLTALLLARAWQAFRELILAIVRSTAVA